MYTYNAGFKTHKKTHNALKIFISLLFRRMHVINVLLCYTYAINL